MDDIKINDGTFNLGGETCMSIVEVAYKVAEVYKKHFNKDIVVNLPKDKGLPKFIYSVEKLKKTGFELQKNIEGEILKTLKFCEEINNE
ncbi:MAG: hypothetical protein KJ736_11000 [Candidatus Omnitrophica bacterium]|nr:hypothetical protein [Candidatus Omnitrophota bacterium]